jgi:MORN repeat variant
MRPWILAGLGLVLLAFALTLLVSPEGSAPRTSGATKPVLPPPPRVEPTPEHSTSPELEREGAPPSSRPGSTGIGSRSTDTRTPGPDAGKPREVAHNHPDGSPRDKVGLDDSGEMHGTYQAWHPNGAVADNGNYVHGKRTGVWRSYYDNGTEREETTWIDGVQQGALRQWDSEGHLLREALMHGVLEGASTSWFPSGQMESRGGYSNGKREGYWEFWFPDGLRDEQRTGAYRADQRIGS